jgi:putative restriction endonuclease
MRIYVGVTDNNWDKYRKGNGREYYAYHGKKPAVIPDKAYERPDPKFLRWHNENVFLA